MKNELREIYVEHTLISSLFEIEENEFPTLIYFYENDNPIMDCLSLYQWVRMQAKTEFDTECEWRETSPALPSSFSTETPDGNFTTAIEKRETNTDSLVPSSRREEETTQNFLISSHAPNYTSSSSLISLSTNQEAIHVSTTSGGEDSTEMTSSEKTPTAFDNTSTPSPPITSPGLIASTPRYDFLATGGGVMIVIMLGCVLICGGLGGVILIRRHLCLKQRVKRERERFFYPPIYINPSYSATVHHMEDECIELENV